MRAPIVLNIVFLLIFLHQGVRASFEPGRLPPAYLALGSSGIASTQAPFFNINPALLAFGSPSELNLQYRNFYNISQLNEFGLSFNTRIKGLPFGLFVSQFGDKNYKEQQAALAVSFTIYERLNIGFLFRNYFLQIKNYGQYYSYGLTAALHLRILSWLNLASVFGNFNEPKLTNQSKDIPVYFIQGIQIEVFPGAQLTLDLFKDERYEFDYRAGLSYQLNKMFKVLAGFRQQIHSFSFGIIFTRKFVTLSYALEIHPNLGASNAVAVGYHF